VKMKKRNHRRKEERGRAKEEWLHIRSELATSRARRSRESEDETIRNTLIKRRVE
jgi:hypothetical protein